MTMLVKLADAQGYLKNTESKAVVNVDNDGLRAYRNRRKECDDLRNAIEDINTVKAELSEVKELLRQFLKDTKNG